MKLRDFVADKNKYRAAVVNRGHNYIYCEALHNDNEFRKQIALHILANDEEMLDRVLSIVAQHDITGISIDSDVEEVVTKLRPTINIESGNCLMRVNIIGRDMLVLGTDFTNNLCPLKFEEEEVIYDGEGSCVSIGYISLK